MALGSSGTQAPKAFGGVVRFRSRSGSSGPLFSVSWCPETGRPQRHPGPLTDRTLLSSVAHSSEAVLGRPQGRDEFITRSAPAGSSGHSGQLDIVRDLLPRLLGCASSQGDGLMGRISSSAEHCEPCLVERGRLARSRPIWSSIRLKANPEPSEVNLRSEIDDNIGEVGPNLPSGYRILKAGAYPVSGKMGQAH